MKPVDSVIIQLRRLVNSKSLRIRNEKSADGVATGQAEQSGAGRQCHRRRHIRRCQSI